MAEEAKKIVVANKRRSRTSIINYIDKLFSDEIEMLQSQYGSEKDLVNLMGYKDISERRLGKVIQLSNEITESIEDGQKYEEEMEKFMDCEVKLSQDLNTLSHFIKSKRDKPIITYPSPPFNNHNILR